MHITHIFSRFWQWYERHYTLNVGIAAVLFIWQLVHLYWLAADVIALRLLGTSYFELSGIWSLLIVLVDYTEIPAIISVTAVYTYALRRQFSWKPVIMLTLLHSQWLHIFWITDEFVINQFEGAGTVLPAWLAWIAILIDYLELPVIADTIWKFIVSLRRGQAKTFLTEDFAE